MKKLLPDTYAMLKDLEACASPAALESAVRRIAGVWGIDRHVIGIIPQGPVSPRAQPDYIILGAWPGEWAHRYHHSQYVRDDPTIRHARDEITPLKWSELRVEGAQRRIMDEAGEFGLKDGITIPQYTLDGMKIGVSLSGNRIDRSPTAELGMTFLSSLASARALALTQPGTDEPVVSLTPRERECLLWIADGKTDWEISVILGISHKQVERHVQRMRQKLGAATRTHAAVIALRLGIIR